MKNLIFGLVLCLSMAVVAQAGLQITVVNPGFEDPCYGPQVNGFDGEMHVDNDPLNPFYPDIPGWEDDSTAAWTRSGIQSISDENYHTGDYCGFLINVAADAENIMWQLTDKTIAAGEVYTFSVWVWEMWQFDAQVKLSLFYDDGLGNHTEVASNTVYVIDDSTWNNYSATFTVADAPEEAIGKKLGIAIEHVYQDTRFWMSYDDVTLEQVLVSNPDPCDGEPDVVTTANLGWELESVVTNCDVYFGDDPNFINNPKVVDAENVEFYNPPGDLEPETTYYWRVDARVDATVYEGDIWQFTTQSLAYSPSPADKESNVAVDGSIEWELASVVTNCDVYFGSDPNFINNPMVVNGQTQGKIESYTPPGNMGNDTTYYWRVDGRVGDTVYESDVIWEFTTESIILEDPCGLTVDAGDTAVFRVKATCGSTYRWIKLDSPPLSDNTGATLTITDVQKDDEGIYFCMVTNSASVPAYSAWVNLMTKRMVAIWEFDGSLYAKDDEGTECWLGDYVDPCNIYFDPNYVTDEPFATGSGQSLQLFDDPCHVRISDSEDFFNFYPQGYTVNTWVKIERTDEWGTIASKRIRGDYYFGWGLSCTNENKAGSGLWQVANITGTSDIADNEWHMVTAAYDGETGAGAVYVDGLVENQFVDASKASTNDQPVLLGADDVFGAFPYAGLLDKTSIYSYALSQVDVAVLYTNVMGGNLCVGGNPEGDLNDDCKVDAQDFVEFTNDWLDGEVNLLNFAVLATDWMKCNLVPECMP